ncbi:MAG: hypothetical protein JST30_14165 [Armatimonadetes bacterium]|nr:hypothetical protein [Armatimonadota bacterium]
MRWLTLDPEHPDDRRTKQDWLDKVDRFWRSFEADFALEFSQGRPKIDEFVQCLSAVSPGIMFEVSPTAVKTLALTPESEMGLRPFVEEMVGRAPGLPGWRFCAYRPSAPMEEAHQLVASKLGSRPKAIGAKTSLGPQGRVEVGLVFPLLSKPGPDALGAEFVVWSEVLFGEERLDKWAWMGRPSTSVGKGGSWTSSAVEDFDRQVAAQLRTRPDVPWSRNRSEKCALMRAEHPGGGTIVLNTRDPQLSNAQFQDRLFASCRFSRFKETFATLILPRFDDIGLRSAIEDRLDIDLTTRGLGGVTGSQTWPDHSRIDVAIESLERLDEVKSVLQGAGLPRQSWLTFYDADKVDEWFGFPDDRTGPPKFR